MPEQEYKRLGDATKLTKQDKLNFSKHSVRLSVRLSVLFVFFLKKLEGFNRIILFEIDFIILNKKILYKNRKVTFKNDLLE